MAVHAVTSIDLEEVSAADPDHAGLHAASRLTYTEFLDDSPVTRPLALILFGCIIAQLLDGFDFEATSFALPGIIHQFHINPTHAGLIGSVTNLGLMLGGLTFGVLSDRFGRVALFQWAVGLYSFGALMTALSPNYHMLLVARFVTGLGIAGEFPVAYTLLAEFSPKRLRHVFIGCGSIAYSTGWFVCALVAMAVVPHFGWRALFVVGVSPALVIFYIRHNIPESVRFLLQQGRIEEAGRITRRLAVAAGLQHVELVPPERVAATGRPTITAQFGVLRSFWVAIAVIGLFHLANNIQVVGFGTWLPSIFLRQGFTLTRSFGFTLIVLAVTPLGAAFGMWVQDKMRRQLALLLFSFLSAMCFFGFGFSFEYKEPIALTVAFDVGYQFFAACVVPITSTLSSEVFPTRVRSLGYGFLSAISRIGSIFGPFVLGALLTLGTAIHQIIYYFALPMLTAALILVVFLRVDPRRRTLEDVSGA